MNGANGYYDKTTGEIVIARDSQKSMLTVFGHEFIHSIEGTTEYYFLADHLRYNSPYVKSEIAKAGSWDTLVQNKITEYQNAVGQTLSRADAEVEIAADAVSEEFFSDHKSIEALATQNRSVFTRLKQWFSENFIYTRESGTVISTPARPHAKHMPLCSEQKKRR